MGQPIKLITKKGAVRRDGTTLIFLQYCHNTEQWILLNTDICIPPQYWNKRLNRINETLPPQFGNVDKLQTTLTQKLLKAEDMVSYGILKCHVLLDLKIGEFDHAMPGK